MLYASKRLQNTHLYQEYQELINYYYHLSLEKEEDQSSFFSRVGFCNNQTGEITQLYHRFEKYYTKMTKSIEQKIYTIEALAKEKGFIPIFVTLTLPYYFHPFRSIKYKGKRLYTNLNPDFIFTSIEEAITQGYTFLNEVYRTFYKRIKNDIKQFYFIKVIEAHTSLIPHLHILFYIPKFKNKIFLKKFYKIVNEFKLEQIDCSSTQSESQKNELFSSAKTDIKRASKYIMKYIAKTLNSKNIFWVRVLDGYKRKN